MSWISDVSEEIRNLDLSKKSLRKFGLAVGSVLMGIMIWMIFKNNLHTVRYGIGAIGLLLIVFGCFFPILLKSVYKIWMGMAFAIGWLVSRFLLTIIFIIVMMPVGLALRLSGKEFLDIKMRKNENTYWVKKNKRKNINYEKMY